MLEDALRRLETKARKAVYLPSRDLVRALAPGAVTRLGTSYGGWSFVPGEDLNNAKVLSCGAGEDISFDLALQKRFGCDITIVDPTPKAIAHFEGVLASYKAGMRASIHNSDALFYDLDGVDFSKIRFVAKAVWSRRSNVRFWKPFDPADPSHSITNFQRTSSFITVEADTIGGIAASLGLNLDEVAMLKLDIEGAEYAVIDWMCANRFLPRQFLVEFDEIHFPNRDTARKIRTAMCQLQDAGYELVWFGDEANCSFLKTR